MCKKIRKCCQSCIRKTFNKHSRENNRSNNDAGKVKERSDTVHSWFKSAQYSSETINQFQQENLCWIVHHILTNSVFANIIITDAQCVTFQFYNTRQQIGSYFLIESRFGPKEQNRSQSDSTKKFVLVITKTINKIYTMCYTYVYYTRAHLNPSFYRQHRTIKTVMKST